MPDISTYIRLNLIAGEGGERRFNEKDGDRETDVEKLHCQVVPWGVSGS